MLVKKSGSSGIDCQRMNSFCAYVKQCGFIDLGYNGPAYTWTNKRLLFQLMKDLIVVWVMQDGVSCFPRLPSTTSL
jgi:hypothetical protein